MFERQIDHDTELHEIDTRTDREAKFLAASQVSWWSRLLFLYMTPLLERRGPPLEEHELPKLDPDLATKVNVDLLDEQWTLEMAKEKPSLARALWKVFGTDFCKTTLLYFLQMGFKISQPLVISALISAIQKPDQYEKTEGIALALTMGLFSLFTAVLLPNYYFRSTRVGTQARLAVTGLICRKVLRISSSNLMSFTTGRIVNMISSDTQRLEQGAAYLPFLLFSPIECFIILIILWNWIGISSLAGFIFLLVLMRILAFIGTFFAKYRHQTACVTDKRVKIMSEIISGMRAVKMYAWEESFKKTLLEARDEELLYISKTMFVQAMDLILYFLLPSLTALFTFSIYTLLGNELKVSDVFVALSCYNILGLTVGYFFSRAIQYGSEIRVAIDRFEAFLSAENFASANNSETQDELPIVAINDASFSWTGDLGSAEIKNIAFSIDKPGVVALAGPVGCGKSTLISALLSEAKLVSGQMIVRGRLSFASQIPWIFSGTVRENILFGAKYDSQRYKRVVKACELLVDFEKFPKGDETELGERGASLSGGQKARINLARALYVDADIYLLDDPLSAVDPKVASRIFEHAIKGYLGDKICVLATHQIQYLDNVQQLVLLNSDGSQYKLSNAHASIEETMKAYGFSLEKAQETPKRRSVESANSQTEPHNDADYTLVQDEERDIGSVPWTIYKDYFLTGSSVWMLLSILLGYVTAEVFLVLGDIWLSTSTADEDYSSFVVLGVYGLFVTITATSTGVTALLFFWNSLRASRLAHLQMLDAVLKSPMHFFDSNPSGRILNRFSKDLSLIDEHLPITFFDFLQAVFLVLGGLSIVISVVPAVLALVVPLGLFFNHIRKKFVVTSRDVKRMESIARSPVYSVFSECIFGAMTIRALKQEWRSEASLVNAMDSHTRSTIIYMATNRWLTIRLDACVAIMILFVATFCIGFRESMDPAFVGIMLVYSLQIAGSLQWATRLSTEIENQMTSFQRISSYTTLESEPLEERLPIEPPLDWPSEGSLQVQRLLLQYPGTSTPVLKGISFDVRGGEKIGIVGRTGAGKSSIISAIFRLLDPSSVNSDILIDGLSILHVDLFKLRSNLATIPQDPILFSGTLRQNLDPFGQYSDLELWEALEAVHLKQCVAEDPARLEAVIAEFGSNWSVGQRQLICFARALLRRNRIVVLDEATANVDYETDCMIQKTIRQSFAASTMLIVAHRLSTIIDCDRVLVLANGSVAEYDHPYILLQNEDSEFRRMVERTGSQQQHLFSAAKESYNAKRSTESD